MEEWHAIQVLKRQRHGKKAVDGPSYLETLTNLERVIDEWVETARELGRPIPGPKGRLMYA
jgi:predicted RNase H-like HicB family nuclease